MTTLFPLVLTDLATDQLNPIVSDIVCMLAVSTFCHSEVFPLQTPTSTVDSADALKEIFDRHGQYLMVRPYRNLRRLIIRNSGIIEILPSIKPRSMYDALTAMDEIPFIVGDKVELRDELILGITQRFVKESILAHGMYKWKSAIIAGSICTCNEEFVRDFESMIFVLQRHTQNHKILLSHLVENIVLDIIGFVSDYVENTIIHALEEKILSWGEIFADLHSRIRRLHLPRPATDNKSSGFRTVFEYLGMFAESDTSVVCDWCELHLDSIPFRSLYQLMIHAGGSDESQNTYVEQRLRSIYDLIVYSILESIR